MCIRDSAGAAPHLGRSALDACELMNVGVNYLREHIISDARVHYAYLDCGGKAPNVVQERGSLLYFVRAPKLSQCSEILERIKKIAKGAALMTETEVEIKVLGGMSDNIPNPTASRLLSDAFLETGAPDFGEKEYAIAREFLAIMPEEQRARLIANGAKQNGISPEEFARRPLNTFILPYSDGMRSKVMTGSSAVSYTHLDVYKRQPKLLPVDLCSVGTLIENFLKTQIINEELKLLMRNCESPFYILTNKFRRNGACAILYDELLANFANKIGEDIFILFISTDDVLLIPFSRQEDLNRLVNRRNQTNNKLPDDEIMTNKIYCFDRKNHKINQCSDDILTARSHPC